MSATAEDDLPMGRDDTPRRVFDQWSWVSRPIRETSRLFFANS